MMKRLICLAILLILTGCGGPDISEDRPTTGKIVALGDSNTEGYGVEAAETYVSLLNTKISAGDFADYEVINLGVSGDKTSDGLARIDSVLAEDPEIVIVALGGNDFLRGQATSKVEKNLRGIITPLQAKNIDVLLVGIIAPPTKGLGYMGQAKDVYKNISKDLDVVLMPNILKGIALDTRYMQSDKIHANPKGHQEIAENMWEYLEPLLRKS